MQIFKTNEFFCGLSIPDPGTIDPIEKKLPRDIAGSDGVDFMKVKKYSKLIYKFNLHQITYHDSILISI